MFNALKIILITLVILDYLATPGTVGHVVAQVAVAAGRAFVTAVSKVA